MAELAHVQFTSFEIEVFEERKKWDQTNWIISYDNIRKKSINISYMKELIFPPIRGDVYNGH